MDRGCPRDRRFSLMDHVSKDRCRRLDSMNEVNALTCEDDGDVRIPPRRCFRIAGAFAVVRRQRVFMTVPGLGKAIAHRPAGILPRPLVAPGEVKNGRAQGIVSAAATTRFFAPSEARASDAT